MITMAELGIEDHEMTNVITHPLRNEDEMIIVTDDDANIPQNPTAEVGVEVRDRMNHQDGVDNQAGRS